MSDPEDIDVSGCAGVQVSGKPNLLTTNT